MESDLSQVLDELLSPKMDFTGLAIIIDEFQELSSNVFLLDTLRNLSENLVGLLIIGAGIPSFLNDSNFEKFIRAALPFTLKKMDSNESLDLIIKPIQGNTSCSRYEIEKLFNPNTIDEVLNRSQGNPLHIKVLCAYLFEVFQSDPKAEQIKLNRNVMDKVMDYYSSFSTRSSHIKNSLETCTTDKLKIFSRLYFHEGFTIKASILEELAFNSIQKIEVSSIQKKKIEDLKEIFDLQLFEFSDPTIDINNLENFTFDELAQVTYNFTGNPIDKMYAAYYYKDLTRKELSTPDIKDFDHLLLLKLSDEISEGIKREEIPQDENILPTLTRFTKYDSDEYKSYEEIITGFEKLKKINPEKELSDESRNLVTELNKKFNLSTPANFLSLFNFEGYYLLITDVSIRGKKVVIYNYFPIKGDLHNLIKSKGKLLNSQDVLNASLDEYSISINSMYLYWLPKEPLLVVYYFDLGRISEKLVVSVRERKFEEAVKMAEEIYKNSFLIKDKSIGKNIPYLNNYYFCLINVNDIDVAKKNFLDIEKKYLLSKINLAYIDYHDKRYQDAKRRLKGILKKKHGTAELAFALHLALYHKDLPFQYIVALEVLTFNIVCWNLALITSQEGEDVSIINSYLKKTIIKDKSNEFCDKRVRYWIDFYRGEKKSTMEKAKVLLKKCDKKSFDYSMVENDIKIFENELA